MERCTFFFLFSIIVATSTTVASDAVASAAAMDPGMNAAGPRGAFPLLCTPWTADAELDVPVLVAEAEFVSRCGVSGVIWPTAGEVLLSAAETTSRAGLGSTVVRYCVMMKPVTLPTETLHQELPYFSSVTFVPGRYSASTL